MYAYNLSRRYRNLLYNGLPNINNTGPSKILNGLARTPSACDGHCRVSVNKEFGMYGSSATGAHELGHRYPTLLFSLVVQYNCVSSRDVKNERECYTSISA